jgi:hypothetical protein
MSAIIQNKRRYMSYMSTKYFWKSDNRSYISPHMFYIICRVFLVFCRVHAIKLYEFSRTYKSTSCHWIFQNTVWTYITSGHIACIELWWQHPKENQIGIQLIQSTCNICNRISIIFLEISMYPIYNLFPCFNTCKYAWLNDVYVHLNYKSHI